MAKAGLELSNLTALLKERSSTSGWALCIGAGTSWPAFPSWATLVERLIARDVDLLVAKTLTPALASSFSYDALIQAANDRLGFSTEEFNQLLITELYSDLKNALTDPEWQFFTKVLSALRLGDFKPEEWKRFIKLVRRHFASVSAIPIAQVITHVYGTKLAPSAILSFNAEPLLMALINAFVSERIAASISSDPARGLKAVTDIVTHSISTRKPGRIPYFFCHGLLPVPRAAPKGGMAQSLDKLVFSEATYLQLANNAFSWQSSTFIDICSSKSVLFIGVSLSDPNMRRWLSWIHASRIQELKERNAYRGFSTAHYWIKKVPSSVEERRWIESAVAHLGVRLIWINSWSEVGMAMSIMLGM